MSSSPPAPVVGKAMVLHEQSPTAALTLDPAFAFREPGDDELLVKVAAASVNPVDDYIRRGLYGASASYPLVIGGDIAGTVVRAGAGSRFAAGDAVYAMVSAVFGGQAPSKQGAFASYCLVADAELAHAPARLSPAHAAAVPLVALTALQALAEASPARGQRILITGASGGVGHVAVQLAKAQEGLHVTALASAPHAAWMRALGADIVVDYAPGAAAALATFTALEAVKFDIIFDVLGGETLDFAAAHCLKAGGIITHVQNRGSDDSAVAKSQGGGHRFARTLVKPSAEKLAHIAALIDAGALTVKVAKELPLEAAADAIKEVVAGHAGGKIVLIV